MPLNLIVCGFLGSGKTTLIRKAVCGALSDRRVVVVENESGRESVDGAYLRSGGVTVVDLRAGCVCCTLRGELAAAMDRIRTTFDPECVVLEPSGLGDLADLLRIPGFKPDGVVMLVDVERFDLLMRMNRDYYVRQFRLSPVIVLTHLDCVDPQRGVEVGMALERINPHALIVGGTEAFDAAWWMETVPDRYANFRAIVPDYPGSGLDLVSRSFSVRGSVCLRDVESLFIRLSIRGLAPVRAKGFLLCDLGWVKADWLATGRHLECVPIAEEPVEGGILSCWWSVGDDVSRAVAAVDELLNERSDEID